MAERAGAGARLRGKATRARDRAVRSAPLPDAAWHALEIALRCEREAQKYYENIAASRAPRQVRDAAREMAAEGRARAPDQGMDEARGSPGPSWDEDPDPPRPADEVLLPGWKPPVGYANGIESLGHLVFVAGQVGWNEQQVFESKDIWREFEQALKNVIAVLAEAGARPSTSAA